jgi:2-polyprenyl-3-methyl-5-hydroxy-6-metoxy-1,4-benzoquinol methylase
VLDLGCGNGYWAGQFAEKGCDVVGVDPSESGIAIARQAHPGVRFEVLGASEDLLDRLAERPFDLVVSTEVVEHLYDPHAWAIGAYRALRPGGKLIASTPYHGLLKDIAIAVADKSDLHYDALRVGGHIKFFSNRTLTKLLTGAGFSDMQFIGTGRLPYMWKSVVFAAVR